MYYDFINISTASRAISTRLLRDRAISAINTEQSDFRDLLFNSFSSLNIHSGFSFFKRTIYAHLYCFY